MIPSGGQRPLFVGAGISAMVTSMPVTTTSVLHHQVQAVSGIHHPMIPQVSVIKHEAMDLSPGVRVTADLYLCNSGNAESRGRPAEEPNEKASVALLDQEHSQLTQKKIKDSLSSFVPDIPGEFDSSNNPESMLRTLIDRPPIGGREFLPLSEQSLLGFRLHPGPLPEQYRLDPMTLSEPHRHHKKKKKHKHKHVDKAEEASITNYSPSMSREDTPPGDPCEFIKPENTINFFPPPHSHTQVHHQPQPQPHSQPQPQPHLIQHTTSSSHAPTILQPQGMQTGFYNMMPTAGVGIGSTPHSVIVGGKQLAAYQTMGTAAYLAGTGPTTSLLNQSLKTPAKPKKKRHNVEGPEGVPKKKKKKDKDKEKSKEKKKRKHHNPDQVQGVPLTVPPSSTVAAPFPPPLISSTFPSIHQNPQ